MNAINKAISEVYYHIPSEILNLCFNDNPASAVVSIDDAMLTRVIRPRVLSDCNLVGGIETYIPANSCYVTDYSKEYIKEYIIEVPKHVIHNKNIISVLGLFSLVTQQTRMDNGNAITSAASDLLRSISPETRISTSRLELVGNNKILVTDPNVWFVNGVIKCVVENSYNLSNLSPRSYIQFSQLVILAIKAYIHNYMIVKLGQGYIYNGHELGIVNDTINNYESANDEYREYLSTTWSKVAYHNDQTRLTNFISGLF